MKPSEEKEKGHAIPRKLLQKISNDFVSAQNINLLPLHLNLLKFISLRPIKLFVSFSHMFLILNSSFIAVPSTYTGLLT